MNIEKSCGIIIYQMIEQQPQFLVLQSLINHHWGFPKGHMENGESEKETAIREVFEETGLHIDTLEEFKTSHHYTLANGNLKEVTFFLGEVTQPVTQIQADEIKNYEWLNEQDTFKKLTFDNTKLILEEALQFLNKKTDSH